MFCKSLGYLRLRVAERNALSVPACSTYVCQVCTAMVRGTGTREPRVEDPRRVPISV
jgi:hypothetical protein